MKKIIFMLGILLFPALSFAFSPLPNAQAFSFSYSVANAQTLNLHWKIAPGYYLYKDRFSFTPTTTSGTVNATVTLWPPAIAKQDEVLGKYQVYENDLTLPLSFNIDKATHFLLKVSFQGCATSGFCYPPVSKTLNVDYGNGVLNVAAQENPSTATVKPDLSEQDKATQMLFGHNLFLTLLGFFGFGLLLAFTPCVLPMIPILSGIIVGQGSAITTRKAFFLSLSYVLAMALTYAAAGVLAGLAGSYLQAFLQSPWVITTFSILFVLLAFSLFGFYELRMPSFVHHKVAKLSNKMSGGTYVGVALMGCLSTLIISPCVTAPLIGALSYIGKTGDAVLGGSALFMMGLGAGIPLMIVGTTEGRLLPQAGPWMDAVKAMFGVLLIAAAIWMLARILPVSVEMELWAALLMMSAVYMGVFTHVPADGWGKLWKGASVIMLVYGMLLLIGAAMGNTNPWQPLAIQRAIPVAAMGEEASFKTVKNIADVQRELLNAKAQGRPVMLDFYADWCIACKQMDRYTFSDARVQNRMNQFVLLRANVTANDADDQALEKYFDVIAPPTILFFDMEGKELANNRVVGEMGNKDFFDQLRAVLGQCEVAP